MNKIALIRAMARAMEAQPAQPRPPIPWYLEVAGPKRIKKGNWVLPCRLNSKMAQCYIRLKPLLSLIHVNLIIQQVNQEKLGMT